MKKNKILKGEVLLVALLAALIITGCTAWQESLQSENENKLKVAATIFPLADIARNVGGDYVNVQEVLSPGASPHTFEAQPSDLRMLEQARALFYIGHGLDDWALELADGIADMTTVHVDEGVTLQEFAHNEHEHEDEHEHGESKEHDEQEDEHEKEHSHEGVDPHYWLNPNNAKVIAQIVAGTLVELDPVNEQYYMSNLRTYQEELNALDIELKNILSSLPTREVLIFHDAWSYFMSAYDLEIAGVFEPAPGKEPTPQYLKELNDAALKHGVKAVFTEPQLASGAVTPFVQDLGLKIFTLDPLGGNGERDSYINLMRYNARTINDALTN